MNIVVASLTSLILQSVHGKRLTRLAREAFASQQRLTLDFQGV